MINLKKTFTSLEVLKGISFSLNEGEVLSIIGPSGSGKSTLLRCITNLERVESGTIIIGGDTLVETSREGKVLYADKETTSRIGQRLGLVFQNFNLFPHFSVLRNITEAPRHLFKYSKEEATELALSLLEKMGLADKAGAYPYQLSGGQQQRVSIARALALHPQVLCFDEPTSALDPELTGEILAVIKELANEQMTMVVVTHEMGFARRAANRVVFMADGAVVEDADPETFFSNPSSDRARDFLGKILNH